MIIINLMMIIILFHSSSKNKKIPLMKSKRIH